MTQRKMNNEYDRQTHKKGNIKVNKHCKMSSHSNKQNNVNWNKCLPFYIHLIGRNLKQTKNLFLTSKAFICT